MKELFYEYNPWWEKKFKLQAINRKSYIKKIKEFESKNKVIILTGMRRVGKSTIMKLYIKELLNKGIDPKTIFYISLDHPDLSEKTLKEIIEEYRNIHELGRNKKTYVFFDEITYSKNYSNWLKVLYDNEKIQFFVSSSSASVLKDDKAFLTGRNLLIEINPLNFNEFLIFKSANIKESESYLHKKYFKDYLRLGGMPEYVLKEDPVIITQLVEDIITKDIILKNKLKNKEKIFELFSLLCERVGKRLTYSKLASILRIKEDTVSEYISYFKENYLIHLLYKKSPNLNEKIYAPKKVYISDIGIRNVFVGFKDLGALFENLVFLKIKNKNPFYYFENNQEIDFVFQKVAIEVKFDERIKEEELELLNKVKYKNKLLIKNYDDFRKLDKLV